MRYELRMAGKYHEELYRHLFPGDGKEAVAIVLCGRHESAALSILLTYQVLLIPHAECERGSDLITWRTERVLPFLEQTEKHNLAILKIHSHPGGYEHFSKIDDLSDREFFGTVFNWSETVQVHGSAVMLPDGRVFGRVIGPDGETTPFTKVAVAGDQIRIWEPARTKAPLPGFAERNRQVFGEMTYSVLENLRIAVVGCSGTGSPTIEQLYRLGVGELLLIDQDKVEEKNLNRIIQATLADARAEKFKTEMMAAVISRSGLGTKVIHLPVNLYDSMEALKGLIQCDVIFGCVDSVEGRHLLSQLTNFYLIPYFDLGVQLNADGLGGIDGISAMVHYIQPGRSSLLSRKAYTRQRLEAEGLLRQDPVEYEKRVKAGYIKNAQVDRPAVLPINMLISSMAIIDFLNRLHDHPFKDDSPDQYARILVDYSSNCIENRAEGKFQIDPAMARRTGRGDCKPFLRLSELDRL